MNIYSVNEKEPYVAWIPTRDLEGANTDILHDLVSGTYNTPIPTNRFNQVTSRSVPVPGRQSINTNAVSGDGWSTGMSSNFADDNFTIAWWMANKTNMSSSSGYLFTKGDPYLAPNNRIGIFIMTTFTGFTRVYIMLVHNLESVHNILVNIPTSALGWHHYAITRRNNQIETWFDGQLVSAIDMQFNLPLSNDRSLIIGGYENNGSIIPNFWGAWDDIRLWKEALDEPDMKWLWHKGLGRGRITRPLNTQLETKATLAAQLAFNEFSL